MNGFPWGQALMGWIHITSAAVVAGGLIFWLATRPALREEGAEDAVVALFRPWFWTAAGLLLATGLFTWTVRLSQGYPAYYFHLVWTKGVLYLVLFGLAGALTKPRRSPDAAPRKPAVLAACVAVCILLLALSAFMRRVTPERRPAGTAGHGPVVMWNGETTICRLR